MGFLIRAFDLLMVVYFVIHVPITVLVDSQSLVPRHLYPDWAVKAVDDHVRNHGDHLVRGQQLCCLQRRCPWQ
jgi:hypothetical protein